MRKGLTQATENEPEQRDESYNKGTYFKLILRENYLKISIFTKKKWNDSDYTTHS